MWLTLSEVPPGEAWKLLALLSVSKGAGATESTKHAPVHGDASEAGRAERGLRREALRVCSASGHRVRAVPGKGDSRGAFLSDSGFSDGITSAYCLPPPPDLGLEFMCCVD